MDRTTVEGRVAAEAMQAYSDGYAAGRAVGFEDGRRPWRATAWALMVVLVVVVAAVARLVP